MKVGIFEWLLELQSKQADCPCPGNFRIAYRRYAESGGTNNSDLLCLQAENISDLEFRVANSGLNSMCNFSQRQSLQVSVTGLNVGTFVFRNFQVMIGL